MSEHHPDMDQIMALAAGRLPPDEAARIEAALTADARRELAAQRAALDALGQLPRPALSTDERSRLRAAVRNELHMEAIRRPLPAERQYRFRRSWLARALPSLAAVASLVAVIGIALNLTDGADEDAATTYAITGAPTTAAATTYAITGAPTTAAAAAAQTTAAPATIAPAPHSDSFETSADEAMLEEEAMMEEAEGPEATRAAAAVSTTTPATTTTQEELLAMLPESAGFAFDFSTDRPDQALLFTARAFMDGDEDPFPVSELPELAARAGLVCWENAAVAAEPEDEVSFMARGLIDGAAGEAYRIEAASADEKEPDIPDIEDEPAVIIHLFAHPDCSRVTFSVP